MVRKYVCFFFSAQITFDIETACLELPCLIKNICFTDQPVDVYPGRYLGRVSGQ